MQNVGSSFSIPFNNPGWAGTFALMGLIGLIPIAGTLALLGWMLTILDNYRAGRTDIPPAGFQYMGRGVNLFVVVLVYGLVLVLVVFVPLFLIIGGAIASSGSTGSGVSGSGDTNNPGSSLFGGGFVTYLGLVQLLLLALYLFYPALIVATERGGIGGGLNPANVLRIASANWKNTVIAGLLVYVALFLGGLGIYACCVGLIFTLPYGYAVVAGVIRFYEADFEAPLVSAASPPAPPPPAPPS